MRGARSTERCARSSNWRDSARIAHDREQHSRLGVHVDADRRGGRGQRPDELALSTRVRASVPKAGANGTGRSNPRVIERHFLSVAGYWVERYRLRAIPACRDQHSEDTVLNQLRARSAEPRGEQAISIPLRSTTSTFIWRAFRNQHWPAFSFVDAQGRVRDHHFREGNYEQSERMTQKLLAEAGGIVPTDGLVSVAGSGVETPADWANMRSPETTSASRVTEGSASPGGGHICRRHRLGRLLNYDCRAA